MEGTGVCIPTVHVIAGFHMLDEAALGFLRNLPQLEHRTGRKGRDCFGEWTDDSGAAAWTQGWGIPPIPMANGDPRLIVAHCNKLLSWYPSHAGRYLASCERVSPPCPRSFRPFHTGYSVEPRLQESSRVGWQLVPYCPQALRCLKEAHPTTTRTAYSTLLKECRTYIPLTTPHAIPGRASYAECTSVQIAADELSSALKWKTCMPRALKAHDKAIGIGGPGEVRSHPIGMPRPIAYHAMAVPWQPHHTIGHTIPYRSIPCHPIPCRTTPYHTIPYRTLPYHTALN